MCSRLPPSAAGARTLPVAPRYSKRKKQRLQVEGLDTLERLSDLWLNDNPVTDLDHIADATQSCKETLTVVYLENTPAAKASDAYLHVMKQMLPKLEYLDSTKITR